MPVRPALALAAAVSLLLPGATIAASPSVPPGAYQPGTLAIELEPFKLSLVNSVDSMVRFLDDVGLPETVRANCDISHLDLVHTPFEEVARLKGKISHVHLSDCDGKVHGDLPPGRGVTPIQEYLAAIQQPDGRWVPGMLRPPLGGDEIQATALAVRALQLYPLTGQEHEIAQRIDRARSWLEQASPPTHEEQIYRMLGLAWAGAGTSASNALK